MNKRQLESSVKTVGMTYLFFFLFGAHYAYLGRWGLQILFWLTGGGFLIWALIDLFTISGKVEKYNAPIFAKLEDIEKREKDAEHAKNVALIAAARGK